MKTRNIFLSTVLTVALTLPLFGQHNHDGMKKTDMKKHHNSMSSMMGKPTVDAKVEGLHMKVWLMTQEHHKKMMKENMGNMMMDKDVKGMKHEGMKMDKATMEATMAGTHCIMLDVTDAASGKEIDSASAKVVIVSPSKMQSSFDLKPMMSRFGLGITLQEKGYYHFTVSVTVNGVSKLKEFRYKVK
jgi:hypothetical protein